MTINNSNTKENLFKVLISDTKENLFIKVGESPEALSKRKAQSKNSMASLRATELPQASSKRKAQTCDCVLAKRHKFVSLEQTILDFYAVIKEGPDFVCTVCHRMMYRLAVCSYNRLK